MFKNRRGAAPLFLLVTLAIMGAVTTRGVVETANNGVLKKNGQTIWCKMQGNAADYCDSKNQ